MANALGLTLPIRLGRNGYFEHTTDVMAQIKANLTNLLLTSKGERLMQPGFGSSLANILFQNSTSDGQTDVEAAITTAAREWMPFLNISEVKVFRNKTEEHRYTVNINYTLLTTNITDSLTLIF